MSMSRESFCSEKGSVSIGRAFLYFVGAVAVYSVIMAAVAVFTYLAYTFLLV